MSFILRKHFLCPVNNKGADIMSSLIRSCAVYRKVPNFWDDRNLCCNLPKIEERGQTLRVFCQNGANGIANSEDPDQTAPLGAV